MINYQNEKEFRNNVYSGKNVTESDCSRHLSYLKSNNTIRFANKLDVCIFNAKGMPRPKVKFIEKIQ